MEDRLITDTTAAAEIEAGVIITKIIPVFPAAPLPAGNLPMMTAGINLPTAPLPAGNLPMMTAGINLPAAPAAPAGAVVAAGPEIPTSVRIRGNNRETIEWMSFG